MQKNLKAIFVAFSSTLDDGLGGVQICTKEYIDVLRNAGVEIRKCTFDSDMRFITRIKRRVWPSLYFNVIPPDLVDRILEMYTKDPADIIFLNQVTLAAISEHLRERLPVACRIIVLSHGLESTDMLHAIRIKDEMPISWKEFPIPSLLFGKTIVTEAKFRKGVDLTISLSPFDTSLERWLGVKKSVWIPRVIEPDPLEWKPNEFDFGFVGTLSHPPNLEGLVQALEAMEIQNPKMRVRIVGGPIDIGNWIQKKYKNVVYLGKLNDTELANEAQGWRAFLHPIFCIPRGCSTKLATGLNWQMPIVTTEPGMRGYEFKDGSMLLGETPEEFASCCSSLLDSNSLKDAHQEIVKISHTSPSLNEISVRIRKILDSTLVSNDCDA